MNLFVLFWLISTVSLFPAEESEAMRVLRIGCEIEKSATGCFNFANSLIRASKEDEANLYFEKGCKLGDERSCRRERWPAQTEVETASSLPQNKTASEEIKPGASAAPRKKTKKKQLSFLESFKNCLPFERTVPNPLTRSAMSEERILGIEGANLCTYVLTLENNGEIRCKFPEAIRQSNQLESKNLITKYMTDRTICTVSP